MKKIRWKPWAIIGAIVLVLWFYRAPINLAHQLRDSLETPAESDAALIASRVDFAQVNAQLSGDLLKASTGPLDGDAFAHLLLYGWLPQQRKVDPPAPGVSARSRQTRLSQVRYKDLNRFMAVFWDVRRIHEVVLYLERESVLQPWRVTKVTQLNICAYDFDCTEVPVAP